MKIFNPIHRQYVSPIELQALDKTLGTLEQGHKEAVKAASDLQVSIANLPMHESEAPYRQAKLAEIKDRIANGTVYGNSAGAIDDIIALTGELGSDQGILGRIESNKKFQEHQKAIDDRKDITELDKEYFKSLNPYEHKDIVDPNTGKVVGYEAFKPKRSPVAAMDWNKHYRQAMIYAAKEAGGGDSAQWMDASGRISSTPSENATFYNKRSGKWERLTKDKLNAALMASIQGDPEAMLSVKQDYEVSLWDHSRKTANGQLSARSGDITNPDGQIINIEDYIRKKADPFLYAASYYNSFTSSDWQQLSPRVTGGGGGRGRGSGGSGYDEDYGVLKLNQTVVGGANKVGDGAVKGGTIDMGKQLLARARENFSNAQSNYNKMLAAYGIKTVDGMKIYGRQDVLNVLKKQGYLNGTNGKTKMTQNDLDRFMGAFDGYNQAHAALLNSVDKRSYDSMMAASYINEGNFNAGKDNAIMKSYRKSLDGVFKPGSKVFIKRDNMDKATQNLYDSLYKQVYGSKISIGKDQDLTFENNDKGKRLYTMFISSLNNGESFNLDKYTMYVSPEMRGDNYKNIPAIRPGLVNSTARFFNTDGSSDLLKNANQTIATAKRAKDPNARSINSLVAKSDKSEVFTYGSMPNATLNANLVNEGHLSYKQYTQKSEIEDGFLVNAVKNLKTEHMEGFFAKGSDGNAKPITDKAHAAAIVKTIIDDNKLASAKTSYVRGADGKYEMFLTIDYNDTVYDKKVEGSNALKSTKIPAGTIMIPIGRGKAINSEAANIMLDQLNGSHWSNSTRYVDGNNYTAGFINGMPVTVTTKKTNGGMKYYLADKEISGDQAVGLRELVDMKQQYLAAGDNLSNQQAIDILNTQINSFIEAVVNQ